MPQDFTIEYFDKCVIEESIKQTALSLTEEQDTLREEIEEFEKGGDYQSFLLETIDIILGIKQNIFTTNIDSYNDFLTKKQELERFLDTEDNRNKNYIEGYQKDKRRTLFTSLAATLILPQLFLFTASLYLSKTTMDNVQLNTSMKQIEYNHLAKEELERLHKKYYEFISTLREDYHKTRKDLEELRKRVLQGIDTTQELIEILSPERIHLERITEEKKEEEQKIYQKK